MRKIFLFMALCLTTVFAAQAGEKKVYTVFSGNTLTYYYDDLMESRMGEKELYIPGEVHFKEYCKDVKYARIDPSMKDAHLTSMSHLFFGGHGNGFEDELINVVSISGMENLVTDEVTNMNFMFRGLQSLKTIDLSHFNTANVTSMIQMFNDCQTLEEIDLSHFNTSKVESMLLMFIYCNNLKSLDLTSFDVSNVKNMSGMFEWCNSLETIYCEDDWTVYPSVSSADMFHGNNSLIGGNGTKYETDNPQNITYAHPDEGTSNPGYFTIPCREPKDLSMRTLLTTTAVLNWKAGSSNQSAWYVTWKKDGVSEYYSHQTVYSPACTMTGLEPGTGYSVKVKALCSADNESEFTEPAHFTTFEETVSCKMPLNLRVMDVSSDQALLTWTAGKSGDNAWSYAYKKASESSWSSFSTNSQNPRLTGLEPETDYEVRVRTYCGGSEYSEYTTPVSFRTAKAESTCSEPKNLIIESIGKKSASFSWEPGASDHTQWEYSYKQPAGTQWFTYTVSTPHAQIVNDLIPATTYELRVRTNCGNREYSEWIETTFTTGEDDRVRVTECAVYGLEGKFQVGMVWDSNAQYETTKSFTCEEDAVYRVNSVNLYQYDPNVGKFGFVDFTKAPVLEQDRYKILVDVIITGTANDFYCFPKNDEGLEIHVTIDGEDATVYNRNSRGSFYSSINALSQEFNLSPATGIESIQPSALSVQKVLRDGQLFILRDGKTYTVTGQEVR